MVLYGPDLLSCSILQHTKWVKTPPDNYHAGPNCNKYVLHFLETSDLNSLGHVIFSNTFNMLHEMKCLQSASPPSKTTGLDYEHNTWRLFMMMNIMVINSSETLFCVGLTSIFYTVHQVYFLQRLIHALKVKQHTAIRSGDEKYNREMVHKESLAWEWM